MSLSDTGNILHSQFPTSCISSCLFNLEMELYKQPKPLAALQPQDKAHVSKSPGSSFGMEKPVSPSQPLPDSLSWDPLESGLHAPLGEKIRRKPILCWEQLATVCKIQRAVVWKSSTTSLYLACRWLSFFPLKFLIKMLLLKEFSFIHKFIKELQLVKFPAPYKNLNSISNLSSSTGLDFSHPWYKN